MTAPRATLRGPWWRRWWAMARLILIERPRLNRLSVRMRHAKDRLRRLEVIMVLRSLTPAERDELYAVADEINAVLAELGLPRVAQPPQ